MPEATAPRVGWVGTGRMGAPMAGRLARAGTDLAVWNRTRSKAEPIASEGAAIVDTIDDLADRDVVFTMVASSRDLEQVVTGTGGLLGRREAAPEVIVDCSTVSAETSSAVRQAAAERGSAFLAAPVSGNGKVAEAGRLGLVVSGPEEVFERVRPLLERLGEGVTYVGDGEVARLVKICHNLLLGVVAETLAEITVLAEKGGVSRAALLEFINNSVLGSVFTRYKTPAYVRLDYTPTFTSELLLKDFDLGLSAGRALDVPLPVIAAAAELVQEATGGGYRDSDFAALLARQAGRSGLAIQPEEVSVDDGLGVREPDASTTAWEGG